MRRRAALVLGAALIVGGATPAHAGPSPTVPPLEGVWTATSRAGQTFRGTWDATVVSATPNDALGSWMLTDEKGQPQMQGTWSARKTPRGWRGAWAARLPAGDLVSGTWEADDRTLGGAKTFGDLLKRTAEKPIAGVWRAGRSRGNWWLQAKQ